MSLGPYHLTELLGEDPFGTLHRAVRVESGIVQRHALVRRFHPHLLEAGLREAVGGGVAASLRLGEARGLARHCRIYHLEAEPWIAYDLEPGVPLSELIRACRRQHFLLGLDQVLPVLRDLAEALEALHRKGMDHGLLIPELVWVSYEGAVSLLDVPVAEAVEAALFPPLPEGLEALVRAPASGAARDLFLLGALGWRLLTLSEELPESVDGMLQALDGREQIVPPSLRRLFLRMMGFDTPFPDLEAFLLESGRLLAEEEHAPSTFNLAFLMHTVLRERIAEEDKAMARERIAAWGAPPAAPGLEAPRRPAPSHAGAWIAASALAAAIVVGGAYGTRKNREMAGLQRELALTQRRRAEEAMIRADRAVPAPALAPIPVAPRPRQEAAPAASPARPRPSGDQAAKLLQQAPCAAGRGVRLRVYVHESGRPLRAVVMEGHGGAADEAAVAAALASTFDPAWQGGRAVREWVEVTVK